MAINKKLIHFNKKEDFEREVANENILEKSIVFIKDSKEIYTHGTLYGGEVDLSSKQEIISDLDEIRSNAALGATALQNIPENYITEEKLEEKGLATKEDLLEISFNDIQDSPISIDDSGEFNIVDESGNIGMKVSSEDGIYVKDVIAGEHILSNKQDSLISGSNIKTINGESILGEGNIVVEGGQQDLSEYAKKSEIPTKISQLENDANYVQDDIVSNGVYAVDASGKLIDYTTADDSCVGVALVADEHKFMITKYTTYVGNNRYFYWNGGHADLSLTNYSKVDGTNGGGYLPKPDGTFGGSTHLSDDFTTWTNGALSDFNGKDNTEVIAAASSDAKDMCTVLNTFNQTEQTAGRSADWYVPALGQLALMYLNMTEINAALAKIGGTALAAESYWSSSEYSSADAWSMLFSYGYVGNNYKDNNLRVRFVRDISVSKSLKEVVSELESSKQNTLISGTNIKTINGESILGSGDIVISGSSSSGSSGAYAEVNHGTGDTTFILTPNTFHVWDEVASLDLSFAEETAGVANEFLFQFTSGATATTLTLPDVKWANDTPPTIAENMIYQISILKGLASVLEFSNIQLINFTFEGTTFHAEKGMTWIDFINSEYNTRGFLVSGPQVYVSNGYVYRNGSAVGVYDTIIENGSYYLYIGSGGGA